MVVSNPISRNDERRPPRRARSIEALYHDQIPQGVTRKEWSTVFDAFVVEWVRSLASDALLQLAPPRSKRAA